MEPPADTTEQPPPSAGRTPRDMALSLLVLLIPVLLIVAAYKILQRGDDPVLVDPTEAVTAARDAHRFPVAQPQGLPKGWRTVSADFQRVADGGVLRLGYLTPAGTGVQVVQSDRPAEALLKQELTETARPGGTRSVAGRDWQRYDGRPGERALVLLEPKRTIIVVGPASEDDLAPLAAALR